MTKRGTTVVQGGKFYRADDDGFTEMPPAPADLVVCRRVADYPDGRVPLGGVRGFCERCDATIVMDPRAPVGHFVPRVCMQCAGFVPLPFGG